METKSLVALDTDHIKTYVFATDRLKDIRGASSILDFLNRRVMDSVARDFKAKTVYTNGGAGLFLIDGDKAVAEKFGQRIQQEYYDQTNGGASISFAVQEIPEGKNPDDDLWDTLELLNYGLLEEKASPPNFITLASHPFMRTCDSCGVQYAEDKDVVEGQDLVDQEKRYCNVCRAKRQEDIKVRRGIDRIVAERRRSGNVTPNEKNPVVWERVIGLLPEKYAIPEGTERPSDFNKLQGISGGKDYLGLIYADGNNMGTLMGSLRTLPERENTARIIDDAVYEAMSFAIDAHLKVIQDDERKQPMFPFDILLIGGDDIVVVTPAAVALDVALTLAKQFHKNTNKQHTLSIGVVLAPLKYPFGMLQDLAESTLKAAKMEGAKRAHTSVYRDTFINFMTVTGGTSHDFKKVYKSLHSKDIRVNGRRSKPAFYATLRPYTVEELEILLDTIREGKKKALGRTKLHQVREAVMKMNLTISVEEGMAVLRNWRTRQREFVMQHVYTLGGRYQAQYSNLDEPGSLFPRITFPWFADGTDTYRTSLLDFVELYDFVAQEGVDDEDEN